VLLCLKIDRKSNTEKVENFLSFLMGIFLSSSDQRFRCYDFLLDDQAAEICNFGQIAVTKGN
jgi:hypothetical protein